MSVLEHIFAVALRTTTAVVSALVNFTKAESSHHLSQVRFHVNEELDQALGLICDERLLLVVDLHSHLFTVDSADVERVLARDSEAFVSLLLEFGIPPSSGSRGHSSGAGHTRACLSAPSPSTETELTGAVKGASVASFLF